MGERALVLSADAWEMPDEKTGSITKGVSVWYVNDYRDDDEKSFGFKPTKVSSTPEMLEHLRGKCPCLADLDFGSRPGAGGKAALTLVKITVAKPLVELFGGSHKAAA